MQTDRVTSLAFRCMTAFALMAVLLGVGQIGWNLYFAANAEVRPGVFDYYRVVRHATRVRDSSGRTSTSYAEESLPVYRYTDADGRQVEVEGSEAHVIAYLDAGDDIEVLVDPAGEHEPMILGFVPLVANGLVFALVGGIFVAFVEFARAMTLRMLGGRSGLVAGARSRQRGRRRVAGEAAPPVVEGAVTRRGGSGARRTAFRVLVLLLSAGALLAWLGLGAPGIGPAAEDSPPEPPAAVAEADAPPGDHPPAVSTPVPAPAPAAQAPAARQPTTRREPSPVETAARRGDSETLARLLAAGGDVTDVPLAAVKTLVAKEDLATLKALFEHGFDLSQHYARQTFGDQAVSRRSAAVVRLVREHGGLFEAPPEFVALVAGDVEALAAALREAPPERQWRGVRIDHFARRPQDKALLEQARSR